jgi:hypothetical protein
MLKSPPSETRRLVGTVVPVPALNATHKAQMFALLSDYFLGVTRERFERDLSEKESAILLLDASGDVKGFTTLMRLRATVDGQRIVAFFSGDTIVAREHWNESELPRVWSRHVFAQAEKLHDARVYWFLISSGYKTYRFLSVFYRDFFPTFRRATPPFEQRVLNALAFQKFPREYDCASGIVRFAEPTPLRAGVAEISARRLADPHVAFFLKANPRHADGDELACLAELTRSNLTAAGRRMVGLP